MTYHKVEGHADLVRDPETNSIINLNSLDHQKYLKTRVIKKAKEQDLNTMKEDLVNLKNEMNEIKSLLKELVNGN